MATHETSTHPLSAQDLERTTLAQVWPLWWKQKEQEIGPKTAKCYSEYRKPLLAFFGGMKLEEIDIAGIVSYRSSRTTAGPGLINHEINCLSQILDTAGLWAPIAKFYKPLRVPKRGPGQALLQEEALWLLEVASYKKKWKIAYLASMVSVNTTCGPGELRNLRLKDVNLHSVPPMIDIVEGAKNDYRVRSVPLNADALWAIRELMILAADKGATLPDHYLFPGMMAGKGGKFNVCKPLVNWKKAWYSLRKEAAKKYPKLITVRVYDLRHHAITSLLENPTISEQTIKDVAGHVSKKILERYSHIRTARKTEALEALAGLRHSTAAAVPVGPVQWTASTLFGPGTQVVTEPVASTTAHRKLRLVKG
jgi:integrase